MEINKTNKNYYLKDIPLDEIEISDRAREDFGDVISLAESIKLRGLISPILVVEIPNSENFKYRLIAGERRTRACKMNKFETISAKVFKTAPDQFELKSLELLENLMRKDMTWSETCKMFKQLFDIRCAQFGHELRSASAYNVKKLAEELGVSHSTASQYLGLAQAISAAPILENCKTANDAATMLKQIRQNVANREFAEALELSNISIEAHKNTILNSYILADCTEYMPKLLPESFDFIEVDPPYAIDLDNARRQSSIASTLNYNEVDISQYKNLLSIVAKESYRILKDSSWLICWCAFQNLELTRSIFESCGFVSCILPLIWVKTTGQTQNPLTRLGSSYETCLYFSKTSATIKRPGSINTFPVQAISGAQIFPPKYHPTTRPVELLEKILPIFCPLGARIFVPFLGSGNTILAAANLNYTATGCELSLQYKDGFTKLVAEWTEPKFRSLTETT